MRKTNVLLLFTLTFLLMVFLLPSGQTQEPPTNPPACSDYTTEADCQDNSCYWYDESCHETQAPPSPPQGNLALNPSLEQDENADANPDYWKGYHDPDVSAEYIWCSTPHSGSRSIKVTIQPNSVSPQWHAVYWRQIWSLDDVNCPYERGETYELTCWYQASGGEGRLYAQTWVDGSYQMGEGVLLGSTDTWTESSTLYFTITDDATEFCFGMGMRLELIAENSAEGMLRCDDFTVTASTGALSILPYGGSSNAVLISIVAVAVLLVINNRKALSG